MRYNIRNENVPKNPFELPNDYVEFFYYPTASSNGDTSKLPFSIVKENQVLNATSWNPNNVPRTVEAIQIEIPRLTISTWSGIAMQCYLITNNMACTLLLPKKYNGQVQGLVFGTVTSDANQQCVNRM